MNFEKAWKMGYSGKGIVVSIIDDGIKYTHECQGQHIASISDHRCTNGSVLN